MCVRAYQRGYGSAACATSINHRTTKNAIINTFGPMRQVGLVFDSRLRSGVALPCHTDNFWTTRGAHLNSLGYGPNGKNGYDPELHAIIAILTGVVGLGDYVNMTNATLVRRLARADGVLLKPDRPLSPLDRMFSQQAGSAAALECGGKNGGARLYGTHATVAPEDPTAPELTLHPTRRLVSHTGRDATMYRTVPDAVADLPSVLLQWTVVAVDVNCSFGVKAGDLYPLPRNGTGIISRSYHGSAECVDGADAVGTGCVNHAPAGSTQPLFDAKTRGTSAVGECTTPNECRHTVALWQLFAEPSIAVRVLPLGDLNAYTALSGYRFRLRASTPLVLASVNMSLVAVGAPGEGVAFTYLERSATAGPWRVRVLHLEVGAAGRVEFDI
jgi:hypothetical protein